MLCFGAYATTETVHYYVDSESYTTTCESGGSLTLPIPPTKKGYTFIGYESMITPVEYLYAPNAQDIDTGVLGNSNVKVRVKFKTLNLSGSGYNIISCNALYSFRLWGESIRLDYKNNSKGYYPIASGNTYDFLFGAAYIKNYETGIIGLGSESNEQIDTSSNIFIGGAHGLIQFMFIIIWDNDVMVRYFVPVLDSSGRAAFYDKIEGVFYYGNNWKAGPVINE